MGLAADLRYAIRVLGRAPAFAIPAVVSLALGIAVNTALFSVVNALLLRPLGNSGGELVRIGRSMRNDGSFRSVSGDELQYLRQHAASFEAVTGHQIEALAMGTSDGAEMVSAEFVSGNYFSVLEIAAALGRTLTIDDDRAPGERPVVVLSDRFWRRRFAGQNVVGSTVRLNNHPFTIAGVAAPGFVGTFAGIDTDVWLPATMAVAVRPRNTSEQMSLALLGRLKRGTAIESAQAEVDVLARRMTNETPGRDPDRGFVLAPARGLHPGFVRVVGPFLMLMMAVVAIVLLIACANVAGLLLARGNARRAELAIRLASGAGRTRVARLLLTESGVLAALGGCAGVLLSMWAIRFLNAFPLAAGPTGAGIFFDLRLDWRVLMFAATATTATTLVFGLLPALQATRVDLVSTLKDASTSAALKRSRLRNALVVVQVAFSFVLLVSAVLLFRSLGNIARLDLGFDADRVVVTSFDLQTVLYDRPRAHAFYDDLLRRARSLPHTERAALAEFVPMGGRSFRVTVALPGRLDETDRLSVPTNRISDGYFATIGQRIVRGREFLREDRGRLPVAIVNQALARRLWPGQDPVGQQVLAGEDLAEHIVVGVVSDAHHSSLAKEIDPFVFLHLTQNPPMLVLHVRAKTDAAETLAAIRRTARELDANAAPMHGGTMRRAMALALVPVRVGRLIFGVAAAIALLLATGGLYALVCYTLERRLKEIGIRVALGATRRHVFDIIVGGTIRLSVAGMIAGAALAAAATRLLTTLLYGLRPTDPLTFGGIAVLLTVVTLTAGYAAARRGMAIDPMAVLRRE